MRHITRSLLAAALLLAPGAPLRAQTAADPSGHWAGAIHVPPFNGAGSREVGIEIDLARTATGDVAGTFSQPAQRVKGLPLSNVALDGKTVTFELKATSGGGQFRGTLADAAKMSGEFVTTEGGYTIPFDLVRTGDAQIAPAPTSAAVGKELEGTWNGSIEANGKVERLVLRVVNQSDGTAAATIVDLDGSNVEIPVAVTQNASKVVIDIVTVGASYAALLNGGTELVGTWAQGPISLPLTFKRVAQ